MVASRPNPVPTRKRRRRPKHRAVKIHRSYTVEEASRVTGCAKGTIRRWISSGKLAALTDQRPHLILGVDLKACLATRTNARPLRPHECFCLKCKEPRGPALGMIEFVPLTAGTGNLKALCQHCLTVMYKAIPSSTLEAIRAFLELPAQQASEDLMDTANPSLNEHLGQEPKPDD